MHSIASVRSASGASNYFAKDDFTNGDYYASENGEVSQWGGKGAEAAGLSGQVDKATFERALNGELPSGEKVGQVENRRAGFDLTFSAPKSVSLMAYVAGDKRILGPDGVQMQAVRQTMAWIERNLAETRKDIGGKKIPVQTGNLLYALFQHDTSRALDPQAHVHAIVANLTRMADGKWQSLHADRIWASNTVIGAVYHAYMRAGLEKIGYQVETGGKHGTFEITGVPQKVIDAFSQRRADIVAAAQSLGIKSAQGMREVTARTRDPKLGLDNRDTLRQDWIDKAKALGFDGKDLLSAAERVTRAHDHDASRSPLERGADAIRAAVASAREIVGNYLATPDPLVDRAVTRLAGTPADARAQFAVASAVRILATREAAFDVHRLAKQALDLGLKGVTIDHVERRIERLVATERLIPGQVRQHDTTYRMVPTPDSLRTEERIIATIDKERGTIPSIVAPDRAPTLLQAASPHDLNAGQLAAATLIVSGTDRIAFVQGVAGAGKSTVLEAAARTLEGEGRRLHGLAFQNKMVADMKAGAGIEAQTIASFVWQGERHLAFPDTPAAQAKRDEMKNTVLVVDEMSMVSNDDLLRLFEVAAALGVEAIRGVGDKQQLMPINAGKAFSVVQAAGAPVAYMNDNLRQRTDVLRTVAELANVGRASAAVRVLGDNVIETKGGEQSPVEVAADRWLALSAEERSLTAVFASGRETRGDINTRIQEGLIADGTLKGPGLDTTVHDRVSLTPEELRHTQFYKVGQQVTVTGHIPELGLRRGGTFEVSRVFANKVEMRRGSEKIRFAPQKLDPTVTLERLQISTLDTVRLHEGETIRWTTNDKERGMDNAALATVTGIENGRVTVELASKDTITLEPGDPMLSRLSLAYALNMHMAQGITTDKGIGVMLSHETNLSNQRLFNVLVTRVRDAITLVTDNTDKLMRQLDRNPGDKTSSLETVGRLVVDGPEAKARAADDALTAAFDSLTAGDAAGLPDNAPILLANLPDLPDLPPMPASTTDWSKGGMEGAGMEALGMDGAATDGADGRQAADPSRSAVDPTAPDRHDTDRTGDGRDAPGIDRVLSSADRDALADLPDLADLPPFPASDTDWSKTGMEAPGRDEPLDDLALDDARDGDASDRRDDMRGDDLGHPSEERDDLSSLPPMPPRDPDLPLPEKRLGLDL